MATAFLVTEVIVVMVTTSFGNFKTLLAKQIVQNHIEVLSFRLCDYSFDLTTFSSVVSEGKQEILSNRLENSVAATIAKCFAQRF